MSKWLIGIQKKDWCCGLEFNSQALFIGIFWKTTLVWQLDIWITIIPLFPIHIGFVKKKMMDADKKLRG